jgi:hypothetical protein
MRTILIAAAAAALFAAPSTAQDRAADSVRGAADAIEQAAPAIDRAADAMLDLDVGPMLDAADPYGPRGRHRTLREIAGRNDPGFERRMHRSIYATTAGLARMMDAIAAAEPGMRRSLHEMERAIGTAIESVPHPLPRGDVDEDWDVDLDDEGAYDEPY